MTGAARDLLAIDLGSSFVKLGWFRSGAACKSTRALNDLAIAAAPLPMPNDATRIEHCGRAPEAWGAEIDRWLDDAPCDPGAWCLVGSVHPELAATLLGRLEQRPWGRLQQVTASEVPLEVRTEEPARVGVDRLLDAVAVNRLRRPGTSAIIVGMGTAITVNLVAADGGFEGGAILAGSALALAALHAGTALLPKLGVDGLAAPPPALGRNTEQALAAGAFWGAAGAVRELAGQIADGVDAPTDLFLTGGGAPAYARLFELHGRPARHVPHLTLAGLQLVGDHLALR